MTGDPGSHATPQATPRSSFVISIWAESQPGREPLWRGSLEVAGGQRSYFSTLSDLTSLLESLGGWVDPPDRGTTEPFS